MLAEFTFLNPLSLFTFNTQANLIGAVEESSPEYLPFNYSLQVEIVFVVNWFISFQQLDTMCHFELTGFWARGYAFSGPPIEVTFDTSSNYSYISTCADNEVVDDESARIQSRIIDGCGMIGAAFFAGGYRPGNYYMLLPADSCHEFRSEHFDVVTGCVILGFNSRKERQKY